MRPIELLWINLTQHCTTSAASAGLSAASRINYCTRDNDIPTMIRTIRPEVLCFDFDYPAAHDLGILQATKRSFPSLPILMFSEDPSARIAVWALRNRVWDYFVKPVGVKDILTRLSLLAQVHTHQRKRRPRDIFIPDSAPPAVTGIGAEEMSPMQLALHYAASHFHEKVTLATLARLSGMGTYAFSRAFKRAHQTTFREYMMTLRMNEAAALLKTSRDSVLNVACSVGFNDPSHFARMFHRYHKLTPSAYRSNVSTQHPDIS